MGECPLCGESTSKPSTRLIKESCGHSKCRLCLLNEESGCSVCEGNSGDISLSTIESIGNFDYRLPATTIPNYEELHTSPRKLDFNKIPDAFNECALDVARLTIDDSITHNSDGILAEIPGPQKVDIGTETEDIVTEEEEEEEVPPAPQPVQQNTHSTHSPVVQTPSQPEAKIPEVFADPIRNNHLPQPETPVVQNTGFIPVTQRADGRQFITIAFIANSSPNKNQHVVTPIINQCLPSIGNMTAVQRPAGNQCIPMIGNINALQSPGGGQFIIRNSNIVQNIVGNQSIPIIGNLNPIQNLTTNQPMSVMGSVNVAKSVAATQSLPSFATVNALQSPTKGQTFSATGSQNLVQNVVGNQPYRVIQAVPKVEIQPAPPVEENVNTTRKQVRTRGLPRIKNVKNVNIVQKSLPNQSDKVNSQIDKTPVKGRRQRKELPVYLVPKKSNENAKSVPAKSPAQIVGCMSPEYKLEDYLLFNKQQQANAAAKEAEANTKTNATNYTQINNKPPESVINKSPSVSEERNCTLIEKKPVEHKINGLEQESQIFNVKADDKKNIKDLNVETDDNQGNQDLSVIFNIRNECEETAKEEIENENEMRVLNGENVSKEDYQNLDALFDCIEKESEKLNGGIFDKEVKHHLDEENGLKHEENQKFHEKMDNENEKDMHNILDQPIKTVVADEEKAHNLNGSDSQHLNKVSDNQSTLDEIVNFEGDKALDLNEGENQNLNNVKETNKSPNEMNHEQEKNLDEELPTANCAMQDPDEIADSPEEKQPEMENEKELSEAQNETKGCQVLDAIANSPVANDVISIKESIQTLAEKVAVMKESTSINGEVCHEKEESQCIESEISTTGENSHDVNKMSNEKENNQNTNENIYEKEKTSQTLYEDISEAENDNLELNSDKLELQYSSNDDESSCHCSDDKTIEEESPMSDTKLDSPDENSNQNLTAETHREDNASSEDEEDSPAYETMSDPEYGDSDEASDSQVAVSKKRSSILETSLDNSELSTFKLSNESDQERDLSAKLSHLSVLNKEEDSQILENKVDKVKQNKKDAILQANDKTNSILSEAQNSEATIENGEPLVKGKRGRKKKSWSDYELDIKPKKQKQKNQQSVVKKPRGRPKKSLSNLERPNNQQTDASVEAKQPIPTEIRDRREENDEHINSKDNQVLDQNSRFDLSDRKEESFDSDGDSKLVIVEKNDQQGKKPRGRAKSKNVSFNLDEPSELELSHVKQQLVVKKPRGRPKKSLSNVEQSYVLPNALGSPILTENTSGKESKLEVSYSNEQKTVKKPRGRPKKSLSNVEMPNVLTETVPSIAMEPSVMREEANNEESNGQQVDKESEQNMNVEEEKSQLSNVDTNITPNEKNDSSYQKPTIAEVNDQPLAVKKPKGRPKKSLSSDEPAVKKPKGRPRKSLPSFEPPRKLDVSPETQPASPTQISNQCEQINETESKERDSDEGIQHDDHVLSREDLGQDETSQCADVNDGQQESLHPDNNESDAAEKSNAVNDNEPAPAVKKSRGRPKTILPSFEQLSKRDVSPETEPSVAMEISNQCEQINEKESKEQDSDEGNQDEGCVLNKEDANQNGTSQSEDMNDKESLHSDVTTTLADTDKNESDAGEKLANVVNDNEPAAVVKKSRGRPKKILPSFELPSKGEIETIVGAEISEQINQVSSKDQHSDEGTGDEEDRVINRQDFNQDESSQDSSADANGGEQENLQSVVTSSLAVVESDAVEKPDTVNNNETTNVVKKQRGRPRKSLSLDEQPSKKPKGRPRKSLSSFAQPIEHDSSQEKKQTVETNVSVLHDENDQTQCLNGTLDEEVDERDEVLQTSSLSMQTVEDESLILEADVSTTCHEDSIDEQLNVTCESEQLTVVKKSRGRPKKGVKPRGRSKKLNHQQVQSSDEVNIQEEMDKGDNVEQNEQIDNQVTDANEEKSNKVVSTVSEENIDGTVEPQDSHDNDDEGERQTLQKEADEQDVSEDLKVQDDENKENKEKCSEKDDAEAESVMSATEEQDLEKTVKVDGEVAKNNASARKYKKFDRMNSQVIVENTKRKRKPKVLLYENEDLEISTRKKKKKDADTSLDKSESRKSLDKAPIKSSTEANESSLDGTPIVKSPQIRVKKMHLLSQTPEKDTTESAEKSEQLSQNESLPLDENSMDSEMNESISSDKKSAKRQRRPKVLLYENEGLTTTTKSTKKKKVEFTLPANEDSLDSSIDENNGAVNSKLDVSTDNCEVSSNAKRIKKSKTSLHENKGLSSTRVKGMKARPKIVKEDLAIMQRFGIKLQPKVVLNKITDPIFLKRYKAYNLHRQVTSSKKPKGRPTKYVKDKNITSKPKKSQYDHIVKLPGVEPPIYECSVCKQSFENYALRTDHKTCAKTIHKCEFCPKKFYKKTHLQYHQRMHKDEKPFACEICGKRFVQKYKLNRHVLVHKHLPDLECNECGRKFTSKEYLKSHLLSHVQSSYVYSCDHCPKSFNLESTRRRHELSHSIVALFKCLRCPKRFKTQSEVARHVKRHQKLRPFACHDCNKTFVTKEEVKRHTVTHSGEKKYICKHCQQQFGRIDNFNRHMQHHHSEDQLQRSSVSSRDYTPENDEDASSTEGKKQEKKKDQSAVKPKKISRTSSNPVQIPINYAQPLTPQSAPSPYLVSHNHDLASVIRETLPDLNNAVPVISSPISMQTSSSLMDPIPLEQALVLNRQIEEKLYTQSSFCEFPGLTRRSVSIVSRRPSYSYERRNSSESNSNSNDGTSLSMNHERSKEQDEETSSTKKDIHVHWRRRTAETFKSKMNQNQ